MAGGADWNINEKWSVMPKMLCMYQKRATEFYMNSQGVYRLENPDFDIRAALGFRWKDAVVFGLGMRYKDFIGLMTYDFNTSYLRNYTGGRGGFEFTLVYQGVIKNEQMRAFFN